MGLLLILHFGNAFCSWSICALVRSGLFWRYRNVNCVSFSKPFTSVSLLSWRFRYVSCVSFSRPFGTSVSCLRERQHRHLLQIRLGEFAYGFLEFFANRLLYNGVGNERLLIRCHQRQTQAQSQQSNECVFHSFFFFFTFTSSHGFAPTRLAQAS